MKKFNELKVNDFIYALYDSVWHIYKINEIIEDGTLFKVTDIKNDYNTKIRIYFSEGTHDCYSEDGHCDYYFANKCDLMDMLVRQMKLALEGIDTLNTLDIAINV